MLFHMLKVLYYYYYYYYHHHHHHHHLLMQGIYTYIPEANCVPREYRVAGVLFLQTYGRPSVVSHVESFELLLSSLSSSSSSVHSLATYRLRRTVEYA